MRRYALTSYDVTIEHVGTSDIARFGKYGVDPTGPVLQSICIAGGRK